MKSNLSKFVGASVISLSIALAPIIASAQVGDPTAPTQTGTATEGVVAYEREEEGFDWGWLGLLGLLGLAGLAGKNRREEAPRYRDPNATVGTTYRE